jgi:hypothetical protein|nr:MAG TPA: transport inhibitor response 1 protein domain protein [Caudoviricetes sp.]
MGGNDLWGSDLFCIGKEKKIWDEKMRRGYEIQGLPHFFDFGLCKK